MLIISLGNGWGEIQQGRTTGDTDDHGLLESLSHAQGIEARRTLVGDGVTRDVRALVEVMRDGRIPTARTDNGMTDTMSHKQGRQYIYMFFVAIHLLIVSSLASVSCHSCSSTLSFSKPPPA